MGEYADIEFERLFDNHLEDMFDDEERTVTCDRCGADDLHWMNTSRGYRLYESNNTLHMCKMNDSEFIDLREIKS